MSEPESKSNSDDEIIDDLVPDFDEPEAVTRFADRAGNRSPEKTKPKRAVSEGKFWQVCMGICFLPITGNDKAVLACLVEHGNKKTGRCFPSVKTIARKLSLDERTVKRSLANLRLTPYVKSQRRMRSSNLYSIQWDAIRGEFDAYKARNAKQPLEKIEVRSTTTSKSLETKGGCQKRPLKGGKNVPSGVTGTSPNQEKLIRRRTNRSSVTAAPVPGAADDASLFMPDIRTIENLGGIVARIERDWRKKKIPREQLRPAVEYLSEIFDYTNSDNFDPVGQQAIRVAGDIQCDLEERGEW